MADSIAAPGRHRSSTHVSATLVAFIVLACTFGGALFGRLLRRILPNHHLDTDSKETVRPTMGLAGKPGRGCTCRCPSLARSGSNEGLAERIAALTPDNDAQRALQSRAVELAERLLEQRWLVVSQIQAPVPTAFLVILVFWLTAAFGSYGLFAPSNGTVTGALFVGSLSVAAARCSWCSN
jgi:hypothetical protein